MTQAKTFLGTEPIGKLLRQLAVPTVIAQLVNMLYNIVDRIYIGHIPGNGDLALTGVGVCLPLILIVSAFAALVASGGAPRASIYMGKQDHATAEKILGGCFALQLIVSAVLTAVLLLWNRPLLLTFGASGNTIDYAAAYMSVYAIGTVFVQLTLGMNAFITAQGFAQIGMRTVLIGAVANIVLDPLLIFGLFGLPVLGIAGAAIATVAGQIVAAAIVWRGGYRRSPEWALYPALVRRVYRLGIPNILMQSAYTFYILGLNLILSTFSDQSVTALGLYYKWQTFFFIPLGAMQTCIVPVISFNYAARKPERCKSTMKVSALFGMGMMFLGALVFEFFPVQMVRVFTPDPQVAEIARVGFRFVGVSFLPQVLALLFPVFFQAIGFGLKSSLLTIIRTVVLFVPLGFLFSRFGLNWFWLTFPVTELVTAGVGGVFYRQFLSMTYEQSLHRSAPTAVK